MTISPIRSVAVMPPAAASAPNVGRLLFGSGATLKGHSAGLLFRLQTQLARDTFELGAPRSTRETRRALRRRLRSEIEADRIVRQALREEAAVEKRVRAKLREQAAIEDAPEGRIRLAYSASELYQILLTAERLNVQV